MLLQEGGPKTRTRANLKVDIHKNGITLQVKDKSNIDNQLRLGQQIRTGTMKCRSSNLFRCGITRRT